MEKSCRQRISYGYSCQKRQGQLNRLINRKTEVGLSRALAGGEPHPWFVVDFGDKMSVRPTHYSLEHAASHFGLMRGWNFEGSQDGENWVILKQHLNDNSLAVGKT